MHKPIASFRSTERRLVWTLLGVLLVQSAAFAWLAGRLGHLDAQRQTRPAPALAMSPEQLSALAEPRIDKAWLQRVIHDALVTRLPDPNVAAQQAVQDYAVVHEDRLNEVSAQLAYFEAQGAISPADMELLQQAIDELHAADRQLARNQLVQAMNDGRIVGRFE